MHSTHRYNPSLLFLFQILKKVKIDSFPKERHIILLQTFVLNVERMGVLTSRTNTVCSQTFYELISISLIITTFNESFDGTT